MSESTLKYASLSDVTRDLTLFFKVDNGDAFSLSDFYSIAESRWDYFRNSWDFIKLDYQTRISEMDDGLNKISASNQWEDFGELVENNRTSSQNPLSNRNTFRHYKDLFDVILIDDLPLTLAESNVLNADIVRILSLQKDDFYQMRERIRIVQDRTADSLGLGDEYYNTLLDRVGGAKIISFKFQDFTVLSSLMELKDTVTSLIPTELVAVERPDPFLNIRNALNNSEIPMGSYVTGFMVPFPAGSTLERIAAKYLGSADSWLEIATANGLQFPYVDEIGDRVYLTLGGFNNSLIIPRSEIVNFALNDEVFVGSGSVAISKRVITNIEEDKNNDQLIITVDGAANLSNLTIAQKAYIFHYTRNTVNSDKFIMIPTNDTIGFPINAQEPWFIKNLSQDLKNINVDIALSSDNDLVFDSTGDLQLVYGLANAAQAANLKISVKTKELLRNPDFGLEEIAGKYNNSEISNSLMLLMLESALSGDDRFEGIEGLSYTISNTSIFINANIRLAGTNGSLPLTFQIPKG